MAMCKKKFHEYDNLKYKSCPQCNKIRQSARYQTNKDKFKAKAKANYIANIERETANRKAWYEAHKEKQLADKKIYRKENKDKCNALSAKRHAAKLQRTPPWLTKEQLAEIQEFYTLAKELQWLSDTTDPLTVDHIIALQGKNVSGLHVPWNLQILTKSANSSKRNK